MKNWLIVLMFLILGCAETRSEPISPGQIRGFGVNLYNEGADAGGSRRFPSSYIRLRIENMTARNFNARVRCLWLDAGTEEEFARQERWVTLLSYTNTRFAMREYFYAEWRLCIRCSIEELVSRRGSS